MIMRWWNSLGVALYSIIRKLRVLKVPDLQIRGRANETKTNLTLLSTRGVFLIENNWSFLRSLEIKEGYIFPHSNIPEGEWIRPLDKHNIIQQKWNTFEMGTRSFYHDKSHVLKKYSYGPYNYIGKSLMTRTMWRRYQRHKKASFEGVEFSANNKVSTGGQTTSKT